MSSGRQAQGGQVGWGRALALKAASRPRQLTPTGTRQDFLLPISSLQAEGKVLATDPCMVGLGLAGASWPRDLLLAPQSPSPLATNLGSIRGCKTNPNANAHHSPPQASAEGLGDSAPESGLCASTFPTAEGKSRPQAPCQALCQRDSGLLLLSPAPATPPTSPAPTLYLHLPSLPGASALLCLPPDPSVLRSGALLCTPVHARPASLTSEALPHPVPAMSSSCLAAITPDLLSGNDLKVQSWVKGHQPSSPRSTGHKLTLVYFVCPLLECYGRTGTGSDWLHSRSSIQICGTNE